MAELSPAAIRYRLGLLFFIQSASVGLWAVNFPLILKVSGLGWLIAYVGVMSGTSALLAPMFGALADDRVPPERLLRNLCVISSVLLTLTFYLIGAGVGWGWVVLAMSAYWLFHTPTWSLISAISFAKLSDPDREFPVIRVMGTIGWMMAGWSVSYVFHSDKSPLSAYIGAGMLMLLALVASRLPETEPVGRGRRSLRRIMGLEALVLFRERDQRVFFITTFLISLPLAAFYPYTPRLLNYLGTESVAGVMTLGQVAEVIALLTLARMMKSMRIKWLIAIGLLASVFRYGFYLGGIVQGGAFLVIVGLSFHGIAYSFHVVTGQIYLERRVDPSLRSQAQALLSSVSGVGSVLGSLTVGQWFLHTVERRPEPHWFSFWSVLTVIVIGALGYFVGFYRGQSVERDCADR